MQASAPVCDAMELRLLEWGVWMTRGRRADGYPMTNVLHPSWQPPAPGQTPTLCTSTSSDRREREIHHCVGLLSDRMRATMVAVYVKRFDTAGQCVALSCQASTVRVRVMQAKRLLAGLLDRRDAG